MMWPPSIFRLRIARAGGRDLRLWLPVILVWPFVVVVLALLTPVLAVASVLLRRRPWAGLLWRALPTFVILLCAARGLHVRVHSGAQDVLVSLR